MAKTHELNTLSETGVSSVPAFLRRTGPAVGNENVDHEDLAIPRLCIIQPLSPELDESDAKFMPGAKQGQMFNSVTKEIYDSIKVVNVAFSKQWLLYRTRKAGGGLKAVCLSEEEAVRALQALEDPQNHEVVFTANHFCILLDPAGCFAGEIVVSCTSTKLKVSRNWNSLIRMKGCDRFAGVWSVSTVKEKNDKGSYFNFCVSPAGWVTEEIFNRAKNLYEEVNRGLRVIDHEGTTEAAGSFDGPGM